MLARYNFSILPFAVQVKYVIKHGILLASRHEQTCEVFLYSVHRFFVEVYFCEMESRVVQLKTLPWGCGFEAYMTSINLSDLEDLSGLGWK